MIVANARMQRPRISIDHFSLFRTPFQMLDLVSMVLLVCGNERTETMARLWLAPE
jgi:hypothetical protein